MRIAMIIQNYPPFVGGTEIQLERLSRCLSRRGGFDVDVITRQYGTARREDHGGGEVRIVRLGRKRKRSGTFGFMVLLFFHLLRRARAYDVLHVHLISSHTLAALAAAKLYGRRIIVKLGASGPYGDIETSRKTLPRRWKLRLTKALADRFVAPSEGIRAEMLANGFDARKIVLLPNMIDPGDFKVIDYGRRGEIDILFAARLTPQKQPEVLLEALAELESRRIRCRVVGDGPLKMKLTEVAKREGLSDKVFFEGESRGIGEYLVRSNLFVSTSRSEGLSNAMLEAMAAGLPVIATRIPGNTEIVEEGVNGFLFAPGSSKELAERLRYFLDSSDEIERCGRESRRIVEERYSFDANWEGIRSLYRFD